MKTAILALLTFVTVATVGCQPLASKTVRENAAPPAIGVEELRAAGLAHLEAGRYDNALRALVEALSRAPEDVGLHYLVGVTHPGQHRRPQGRDQDEARSAPGLSSRRIASRRRV